MNRITTAGRVDVVIVLGRKFRRAWLVVGCLAGLVAARGPAEAANFTWTGAGNPLDDNQNWGHADNWDFFSIPPNNGTADVFFQGVFLLASRFCDLADNSGLDMDVNIESLTFNSTGATAGWGFRAGALTVDSITNNDDVEQGFANDVRPGASLMTIDAAGGDLRFGTLVYTANNTTVSVRGGHTVQFINIEGAVGVGNLTMSISEGTVVHLGDSFVPSSSAAAVDRFDVANGTLSNPNHDVFNTDVAVYLDTSLSKFNLNGFDADVGNLSGDGLVITEGGTLTIGLNTNLVFAGVISGTGGLTKDHTGVYVLDAVQTYTGATNIKAGTLQLGVAGGLSNASDVIVWGGGVFDLNGTNDTVDSISGGGTIRLGGARLVVNETPGLSRTFNGNITEAGELQMDGDGFLILEGTNSFTTLDINAGVVQVLSQANLGSGVTVLSGGELRINASFTNTLTMVANGAGAINVNTTRTLTQNGVISDVGSLTKLGGGTLVLGGNNTYLGDTIINAGVLQLGAANRISNSSDVTLVAGATFALNNFAETVASLSGTGGTINTGGTSGVLTVNSAAGPFTFAGSITGTGGFNKQGAHTLVLTGNSNDYSGATNITGGVVLLSGSGSLSNLSDVTITSATWDLSGVSDTVDSISGSGTILLAGATLTVDETGSTTRTFSGGIFGAGALVKNGTHTMVLTGNNSYGGATTLNDGVLRVASSANLGNGGLIFDTARLNTTASFTNSRAVLINANDSATFDVNASTTLTQSGVISGASTTTLFKEGSGTLTLQANNAATFSGAVDVNAGTLNLGTGDVLGNSTSVDLAAGTTLTVTQGEDIGGLTGSGNVSLASGQILEVGLNNLTASYSGDISGAGGFTKRGSGIYTVSGAFTNTGTTRVQTGTLVVNGTHTGGGDYTVDAGAKLAGNGTISGNVAASGTIAPGTSPGTFTIGGNLTLSAQSELEIEIGGTLLVQRDFLDVDGNAQLDGTLAVTLINSFNPAAGNAFDILDWGTLAGTFDTLQLPALTGGQAV